MPSRQATLSDSHPNDSFMSDSSDDEQVSELRDWTATDFWLGKKYFELNLLRIIIKDHPCCEPATLESCLHETSQVYPFDQHLNYLQDQLHRDLWRDTSAHYKDFIVTVGRVQRLGTTQDKSQLKRSISHFGGNPARAMRYDLGTSRASASPPTPSSPVHPEASEPRGGSRRPAGAPTPQGAAEETASPLHVSTLEHYGNSVGESPNYTFRRCLPLTETTMTFRGRTLEASGKTLKEAKQQVAKAACAEFGLQVPSE